LYVLNRGDNQLTTLDQGYYSYPEATVFGIAADEDGLYWLERSLTDVGSIMYTDRLSIDSGEQTLEPFVELSEGIAVYQGRVYWTASSSSSEATGSVFSVGIAGSSVLTIATGQTNPSAVAVDASGVYWTNRSISAGAVMRASALGGDAVAIATNQNGPHGLTLDSRTVYWTNSDGGEVMKLAK
jgi:hypothetical protein